MAVLVTGGAGYIGSHTLRALAAAGYDPVVLDNLENGHRAAVAGFPLVRGDLREPGSLTAAFAGHRIEAVLHFAAYISVGEAEADPGRCFQNNTAGALNLLQAMARHGVERLVFSSTAAVYGGPHSGPIPESAEKRPAGTYGHSKWLVEQMLPSFASAHGLRSIALRYFNAAGADSEAGLGEDHRPETHLIPLVLQAAQGRREAVDIFGTDYPTPDGTCVRDYVHVCDLAAAHVQALRALEAGLAGEAFNLGNGAGFSVRQVIDTARAVTGQPIRTRERPRRSGDPAILVADASRARAQLGWEPRRPELESLVASAWEWMQRHPDGDPE
jgi:UDP-glucose 4-epimerase